MSNVVSDEDQFVDVEDSDTYIDSERPPIVLVRGRPYTELPSGVIELQQGQLFNDVNHFRQILRDFTIQEGFALNRVKNESHRVTVKCKAEGCTWRVHASPTADGLTYKIKSYNGEHTCRKLTKNEEANATWIANRYGSLIRSNPDMKISLLETNLRHKYGLVVSTWKLYRAKQKAFESAGEDHKASFKKLYNYGNIVRITNSGSIALVKVQRPALGAPAHFQRFFLRFYSQKTGYLSGCRPFIGLDRCHLKGPFGGVLLTVVALDANCGVFPIAICVVEAENNDKKFWPRAWNRYCYKHIYANFKKDFPALQLRSLFWAAAKSSNLIEFNAVMSQIKAADLVAYSWLLGIPSKHWSRHGFEESIKVDHWATTLPPAIHKRLEDIKKEARHIIPIWAGEDEYEVKGISRHYIVKLFSHHCECGLWKISWLPCKHAVACVNTWRKDLNEYVHPYLKKEAYLRTYSFMIHLIPDESTWPEVEADNEGCGGSSSDVVGLSNAGNVTKRMTVQLDVGNSSHNLSAADFETFTGDISHLVHSTNPSQAIATQPLQATEIPQMTTCQP
ncbi:hypothetical protein Dsin_007052 [Dipteronia sinensis]|uniref:SWIM-type domain-containing protein n=1 Tax=Dipteronia sinensis TaxID=43782 RepID=A0AAE0B0R6_9ROSI|nr:hypothetical protein Dsin_007052 [Dipteronia sinensis]